MLDQLKSPHEGTRKKVRPLGRSTSPVSTAVIYFEQAAVLPTNDGRLYRGKIALHKPECRRSSSRCLTQPRAWTSQVLQMLSHVNKRVRDHREIGLPLPQLVALFQVRSPASVRPDRLIRHPPQRQLLTHLGKRAHSLHQT